MARLVCVRAQQDAALSCRQHCPMNTSAEVALVLPPSPRGHSHRQKLDSPKSFATLIGLARKPGEILKGSPRSGCSGGSGRDVMGVLWVAGN